MQTYECGSSADGTPYMVMEYLDGCSLRLLDRKLIDFGIAKSSDRATMTKTGVLKGSLPYMAPEQARAESVDRRADIYAMGAILRELVTGTRVWRNRSVRASHANPF